ncbi:MAG: hypothetical protein K1X86_15870 [Ignavibacteria bacterium]|nr:hypothetical protein [Ignavibacteria bacterium]
MDNEPVLNELQKLLEINSLEQYSEQEALNILQNLIEYSNELNTIIGTEKAINLSKTIQPTQKFTNQLFLFYYFIGIAWGDLKQVKHMTLQSWDWEHPELANEVINFRTALLYFKEEPHTISRYLQICTNLANSLDYVGRFIPSMELWKICLRIYNKFGMAMASKGNSLIYHANNTLFDEGHRTIFIINGCKFLKQSLQYEIEPNAKEAYSNIIRYYEKKCPEIFSMDTNGLNEMKYDSEDEIEYRKWAFLNTLFLHPLNDIETPHAEYDPLLLPTMTIKIDEAGSFHSFFNEIKQEYISARYLFYEGTIAKSKHFSDKDVAKYDMYDFSKNSLHTEKVKSAYKIAYAIFDKVSFFINYYMKLNIPEKSVNFRTIWFEKNGNLRVEFEKRQNLMFRALYWLSKDLFYKKDENFTSALEPDARELANIRNHIEHKSFRVFSDRVVKDLSLIPDPLQDNLSFSIGETHFHSKTLKILKMAREAIMYLSLGINHEERSKERPKGFVPSIEVNKQFEG